PPAGGLPPLADEGRQEEPQPEDPDIDDNAAAADAALHRGHDIPETPAARRTSSTPAMLGAGAAGGVIALLLAGGLHVAGLLPLGSDAPGEDPVAVTALETQLAELREQVAALEGAGG